MLIEVDAAQLEWRTMIFSSQDKVGLQELNDGVDVHTRNQDAFKLPDRLTSKKFLFRAIYRGPAYAYAHDPEFMHVSTSEKFWQDVIDRMYTKYSGLAEYQARNIREVNKTGRLTTATSRVYEFKKNLKGEYSERDIANWPNQGLGAELVAVYRVSAFRRLQKHPLKERILFVNTVHDSCIVDADIKEGSQELFDLCCWLEDIYTDVPRNFEKVYGVKVNVPISGECKFGMNWKDMTKFDRAKYMEVYNG